RRHHFTSVDLQHWPPLLCPGLRPPRLLHSFPTRRSSDLLLPTRPALHQAWPATRCRKDIPNRHHRRHETERRTHSQRTRNGAGRSEEHTSELQSLRHLVCRLLLEKKNDMTFAALSHTPFY